MSEVAPVITGAATAVDHLVVAAATLEQGVAWCEATLGVTPGPGGRHALMGTHNRLLNLGSAAFPHSYLEIIAIDPEAPAPGHAAGQAVERYRTTGPLPLSSRSRNDI
jgi:hypothetical protein